MKRCALKLNDENGKRKLMKKSVLPSQLFVVATLLAACTPTLHAQQYLYTNDNVANHTNSTTALRVSSTGAVKAIATYSTGGKSTGGNSYFALSPISSCSTVWLRSRVVMYPLCASTRSEASRN